jgi:hypothetical protein
MSCPRHPPHPALRATFSPTGRRRHLLPDGEKKRGRADTTGSGKRKGLARGEGEAFEPSTEPTAAENAAREEEKAAIS